MVNIGFLNNKKQLGQFLFLLSVLFFFIIVYVAFSKPSVSYDDYYTLGIIRYSFLDMINATAENVHPPIYYIILKLFTKVFGIIDNVGLVFAGKVVSLMPIALLLIINLTKVRKEFGFLVAGIFSLLLCSMTQIMFYATVIRMYSWGLFFLSIQAIFLYDIIHSRSNKAWFVFTIFSICAIYTHYFTAISSIFIYLVLFVYLIFNNREKIKFWFLSAIVAFVSYLPWMGILFNQVSTVSNNYWIKPLGLSSLLDYFQFIFAPSNDLIGTALGFLLFLALLALIYLAFNDKSSQDHSIDFAAMSVSVIFLTILSGIVLSLLIRPIFISRYILPACGPLWLGFSILLARGFNEENSKKKNNLDSNKLFYSVLVLILAISILSAVNFAQVVGAEYSDTIEHNKFFDSVNDGRVAIFDSQLSSLRYGPFIDKDKIVDDSSLEKLDNRSNGTLVFVKMNKDKINESGHKFNKIYEIYQDDVYLLNS